MRRNRWKVMLILGLVVLSIWAIYPLKDKINLGLDLQGGMNLRLEVDITKLPEGVNAIEAVDRALMVIRNRIDQFGVKEPLVQKEGTQWITVQLPGIKDPQRAIDIIGRTALLEFKLVDENGTIDESRNDTGRAPAGDEILYDKEKKPYLVEKEALLTGEALSAASVELGDFGKPHISLEFSPKGARKFASITRRNVGKRLAIILDSKVHSAPVIQDEITGGKAVITGSFTLEEANDLAIVLKAGALPAPVNIIEKRLVGATLGEDSIKKGLTASLVGLALVFIFMIIYYGMAGFIADIALVLNFLILMGAMAGFKATLTLPGIAGIILSVAMAVDANVLIYERIREELREGKSPTAAISAGYKRALSAIVDGNLTTLITGVLLFQFGSGPVKGFGVTLCLGLLISMFTAIVVTRVIFDEVVPTDAKKISI